MYFPGSGNITSHSVCGKEENISIASRGNNHSVCGMSFYFTCNQIASNNPSCLAIHDYQIQHFVTVVRSNFSTINLSVHCGIRSQKQLLPCLSFRIKSTRNQHPSKGTVVQITTVFTRKGNTLSYTLVNNICRNLSKTVYVCLTRTVIAPFYGIVKQSII